jgi:hypothetical protein
MKSHWPWVSRETFEIMRDARDSERENARMLRNLLLEFGAILRPQAIAQPAKPEAPAVRSIELSPVAKIIREQTSDGGRTDHALASHLWTYANQLKASGKTEDEVVGALIEWQTSEAIDVE